MKKFTLILLMSCLGGYIDLFSSNSTSSQNTSLESKEWVLGRISGTNVFPPNIVTIYFSSWDGSVSGSCFCNEYLAPYENTGSNNIRIGMARVTRKFCGLLYWENRFLESLKSIDYYDIVDGILVLYSRGQVLLEFYEYETAFPWDSNDPEVNPAPQEPEPPELIPIYMTYDYDNSGNRIERDLIYISVPKTNNSLMTKSKTKKEGEIEDNNQEIFMSRKLNEFDLKIYPNPTKGNLKIEIGGEKDINSAELYIYDLTGKILFSTKEIKHSYDLNISSYHNGVYILVLSLDGKSREWKIIKE